MEYIKLFENFEDDDFDTLELEYIILPIIDYGFNFNDVDVSSGVRINKDYIDLSVDNYFSHNNDIYKNLSIKFKSHGYTTLTDVFFEELKSIIEHIESRYNFQLNCIYTSGIVFDDNHTKGLKHVYYKNTDIFKNKLREYFPDGKIKVKYHIFELMFEIK